MRNNKRVLPIVILAIFLDFVASGILIPILPQLLAEPSSKYYLLTSGVSISYAYVILGFLIAVFPICLFFSTPMLGEYSDHVGRRKVMMFALFGTSIALGMFAVGVMIKSLTLLFISRILGGLLGGNISVAQAAIADITPEHKRTATFGLVGAAYGAGFILGPAIGGILSDPNIVSWFNASTPFWAAGVLALMNAILVFMFMPKKIIETEQVKISWRKALENIVSAYGMKRIRMIFATNFLFQAGLALFATFFAVFLTSSFGWNQVSIGYYIAYVGVWVVISQVLVLRFLSKRFDDVTLLRIFLIAGTISVFLYYLTSGVKSLLIVGACFAITNGIAMAILPSLASRRATERNQGAILGINGSVQALAHASPPIIAGLLAAQIAPSAPVYIAGAVIGGAWLLFMFTVKKDTN